MKTSVFKKMGSLVLAVAMVASLGVSAYAEEVTVAGADGTTPVTLEAEGAAFSVTVPMALPVQIDADGVVTTATDCKIINNSHGQVEIKNAAIDAAEGWTVVNYDKDMTKVKVGTKEFGFKIQNDVTGEDGALGFTSSNWAILDGANDADTDELVLAYDMNCAAQATAIEGDTVADVIFTIGFYEAA